jgi:putative CocE/NonD family hydrolase
VAWYDWILKGGAKPAFLRDHVMYYVAGLEAWKSASSLSEASAGQKTFYLSSPHAAADRVAGAGELAIGPGDNDVDNFIYDPSLPGHNEGFEAADAVSTDYLVNDSIIKRISGDGLIYDTDKFKTSVDFIGKAEARLSMRLDVPDTDFRVQLYAVEPGNKLVYLSQDTMRARYRNGDTKAELVPLHVWQTYKFDRFYFNARRLPAGSFIRMVIVPLGASIHDQRNRNSGGVVADEIAKDNRVAHIELALGKGQSQIDLPVANVEEATASRP